MDPPIHLFDLNFINIYLFDFNFINLEPADRILNTSLMVVRVANLTQACVILFVLCCTAFVDVSVLNRRATETHSKDKSMPTKK